MDAEYAAQLHPAVKDWIHTCYSRGFAHGSTLAAGLGASREGRPGMSDNCAWSDKILEILCTAGWIIRAEKPTPSHEQLFFGWGGRPPGKRPNAFTAGASEFGYSPNQESSGLRTYVGVA